MALVQYGGGILDMRGSIGGQVHSRNPAGNYIRARTTPVNPDTGRQNAIRVAIQSLAQRWSNVVTQAQRDVWEVYAASIVRKNKLGATIKLSGFNHFIRSNAGRLQLALTVIDDGPTVLTLPTGDPVFAATVSQGSGEISVVFDDSLPWATDANAHMIVAMSLPHTPATNFIGGPFRIADSIDGIDPGGVASPQTMAVPFTVAEGQVVKCRARISENDGRLSDFFQDQVAVVA